MYRFASQKPSNGSCGKTVDQLNPAITAYNTLHALRILTRPLPVPPPHNRIRLGNNYPAPIIITVALGAVNAACFRAQLVRVHLALFQGINCEGVTPCGFEDLFLADDGKRRGKKRLANGLRTTRLLQIMPTLSSIALVGLG